MILRSAKRGLSLVELMVVVGLAVMLMALSLSNLKPAAEKGSTLGLATAIADEFRSARQLAISRGCAIAVGLSRQGSETTDSLYRLEGWNRPRVTWSIGYGGDYPSLRFAAAGWAGAAFATNVAPPPLTKLTPFNLAEWIPADFRDDAIFCFTPDGGLVTNGLPSLDGRYTVVVANSPTVENQTIKAGLEPCVIYLSPGGAVEISKQLPGASPLPTVGTSATAVARKREQFADGAIAKIYLSAIKVRPDPPLDSDKDALCTPGKEVTFELYAYDPEGRQLFTQWKQTGPHDEVGNFGFPFNPEGPLKHEVERMEFIAQPPNDIDWNGADIPTAGCFRARWTWTVPITSSPGDEYQVEADVQDATGTAQIQNPITPVPFEVAPRGRLLAEIRNDDLNRWEIVRMDRHGGGRQVLTPPGLEESMPSVDGSGTRMAFLQSLPGHVDQRYVKIRSLTGGGERAITDAGRYTSVSISPNGAWVAYRLDGTDPGKGQLFIQKLDPGSHVESITQNWRSIPGAPKDLEPDRVGWSSDGQYVVWADGGEERVPTADGGEIPDDPTSPLNPPPPDDFQDTSLYGGTIWCGDLNISSGQVENHRRLYTNSNKCQLYAPTIGNPPGSTGRLLMFVNSTNNPVICTIPFRPDVNDDYGNARGDRPQHIPSRKIDLNLYGDNSDDPYGSGDYDDGLPNISSDGLYVVFPRYHRATKTRSITIAKWSDATGRYQAEPKFGTNSVKEEIRSVVWIP